VVYFNGDSPTQDRVYDYQVGAISIFAQDNASFGGSFIQVPASSTADLGTSTPAGNFTVFHGNSGSSFTLDATPGSSLGTPRSAINAIQIVPVAVTVEIAGLACSTVYGSDTFSPSQWSYTTTAQDSFLYVTKASDDCTARLFQLIASHRHLSSATVTQYYATGTPTAVTFQDGVVTNAAFKGVVNSSLNPEESIAFAFKSISVH
jgi:hypothetical protein